MITILKKSKGLITFFWILCLFIALVALVTNIKTVNAALDPNKILTSTDIPDPILLSKLTTLADVNIDGHITIAELSNYTDPLNLANLNITSIEGLGYASSVSAIDLSGNNGLLTIQDNIFLDCTALTSIILPDNVESIGNSTFEGCTMLYSINLPTKLTTIGEKSFLQCTSLKSITLPANIYSIGNSAFSGSGLTSIEIPNPQVTIGSSCFNGCTSLVTVSLPEGMTTISMECFKATGLTGLSFPTTLKAIAEGAFSMSKLTSINLTNCTELTSIKSGAFSATPITSAGLPESLTELGSRAFENCSRLFEIKIPSKIATINSLTFSYCTSLVNVTFTPITEGDYTLQEIAEKAFYGCTKLGNGTMNFMQNLNNLISIGDYAFAYCSEPLKDITSTPVKDEYAQQIYIGINIATLPDSLVTLGSSSFIGCSSLTQINIPNNVTQIKDSTFKNCYDLSVITLSSTLTTIGINSFENCKSLINISFPASLTTIGNNAFSNCANEKYKTINSIRQYIYTGLSSLSIPESVTSIGTSAFSGCYNLDFVHLPAAYTKLGDSVFQGCSIQNKSGTGASVANSYRGLKIINIPDTLISIGNSTFYNCYNLFSDGTSLVLPNSLTSIGNSTFYGCVNITETDFGNAQSLLTIGSSTFFGCAKISLVDFGSAENLTSIGTSAFYNCASIQGLLRIPDKIKIIQTSVFQNCTGITSVEFPDGLTSIAASAFYKCISLISVTLPASTTFVSTGTNSSFFGCTSFSNAIIKAVPAEIPVNENASIIIPIKCFSEISAVEMGDENTATYTLDSVKPQVTINGKKSGQTTATVQGVLQYQAGVDSNGGILINKFDCQVQYTVNVTAKKCTSSSLPQSKKGLKLGSTLTLIPTIIPSDTTDLNLWSSDNTSVATVNAGVVTPIGYGTTTIRLKVGDQPEVQCQVNVCAPASALSIDKTTATLIVGQTVTITPTISYSATYDNYKSSYPEVILWSSSNNNIATVNESGLVTTVGYGIATITARADAGGLSKTFVVTSTPASSAIILDKSTLSILKGNTATLTMTLNPSNLPSSLILVSSSNPTAVAVSVNQNVITVIAQKGGTAVITAKPIGGIAATCTVSVNSPLTSITATAMAINRGAARTIAITKTPTDSTDVLEYSSNNTAAATVDTTGKVTAVGKGLATIHISSKANPSVSANCEVNVSVAVTSVLLNMTRTKVYIKDTLQLTAGIVPFDATNTNKSWSSVNPTIATVDQNGKVTPIALGTAVIKVSTTEGNYYASCTVTVVNLSEIAISATDAFASEAGTDTGTFTVSRAYGGAAAALTVYYTISGTATNGTDYYTIGGSVIIPAGSTTAKIIITPKNDTTIEYNETVTLKLTAKSTYTIGASTTATATLFDNDKTAVSIIASDSVASETAIDTGKFTVSRVYGSTKSSLTVYYSISGTATNSADYNAINSYVVIPAGLSSATITITPRNDTSAENNEAVILTLSTNSSSNIGVANKATITIIDNDKTLVSISATDGTASESITDTGKFTVTRAYGSMSAALTVNYTISGTATNGTDYNTINSSVIIPAGSTTAAIVITPKNDTNIENNETVILTLSASSSFNNSMSYTASVIILDNDKTLVTISATDALASEPGTNTGKFTFTRAYGSTSTALTVYYTISGTAINGTDYNKISAYVIIPAGATSITITLTPRNDTIKESSETVILTLSANSAYNIGTASKATITIADND